MFGLQIALCLTVIGAGLNTHASRFSRSVIQGKCTRQNLCGEGEGDCDSKDKRTCAGSLFCGKNNCFSQYGVGLRGDKNDCCTSVPSCDQTQIVTQTNRVTCCTKENPCGEREGDCEEDSDCAGSLVCGTNNCKKFHPFADELDDCCERPKIHKPKPRIGACTAYSPCGEGEGDCHDDSTCAGSLVCGSNNCRQFHGSSTHPKFDCCVKKNPW